MEKKFIKPILISVAVVILLLAIFAVVFVNSKKTNEIAKNSSVRQEAENVDKKSEILEKIDSYQKRYFEIVKRHDAFLDLSNSEATKKDFAELKSLFDEVKNEIPSDNEFIVKYDKIKNEYMKNDGNTTNEMNEFALRKYRAFDGLLNETYKTLETTIPENEFEGLKASQKEWLTEVENYGKVYESKGFGTIGNLVKLGYEINMRAFRTLLLMMYLK